MPTSVLFQGFPLPLGINFSPTHSLDTSRLKAANLVHSFRMETKLYGLIL